MTIGVLGGTFDPVHNGHLRLAHKALEQFHLEKVLFVPAFIPPHKQGLSKISQPQHRCAMIEKAIAEEPRFELNRLEIDRTGISYTIDTLKQLQGLYPSADFSLMMGSDTFETLHSWYQVEGLKRKASFLVAPRGAENKKEPAHCRVQWIEMESLSVSSSEIRQKIEKGEDVQSSIPQPVWEYLVETGLYRRRKNLT